MICYEKETEREVKKMIKEQNILKTCCKCQEKKKLNYSDDYPNGIGNDCYDIQNM